MRLNFGFTIRLGKPSCTAIKLFLRMFCTSFILCILRNRLTKSSGSHSATLCVNNILSAFLLLSHSQPNKRGHFLQSRE
uniref:Uncharacterized protein n=1 Tax=Mus spicilegus TaxID=10103 RepID=A0A8C6GI67_MUSSI